MATDIIRTSVQLNQDGADELARGNLSRALICFRNALTNIINFNPVVPPNDAAAAESAAAAATNGHVLASMGIMQAPLPSAEDLDQLAEEESYTYRRPFVFNGTLLPRTQDGIAVFSGVAIFNMAVTFHRKSMVQPQQQGDRFRGRALHLYGSSIDLFSRISPPFDLSGIIAIAINNRASLYFDRGDYQNSDGELHRLETYLIRAEHSLSTKAIMESLDFQGMIMNQLTMRKPRIAQAA